MGEGRETTQTQVKEIKVGTGPFQFPSAKTPGRNTGMKGGGEKENLERV